MNGIPGKQKQTKTFDRALLAAALVGILTFLAGLAFFAYAGTYSRFWADDYCYTAVVKQNGLLKGAAEWYQTGGNRVSTVAAVALADSFGWRAVEFSPLAVLALWTGAWVFFLAQLARRFHWTATRSWLFLLALVEVYFAVLLAPDRLQAFYWRMGSYHYTLPIPLLLVSLGLLAGASSQRGKRGMWMGAASVAISFFAAGFSETHAAMQAGALGLALAAALIYSPREQRRWASGWVAAALAATLLMMGIMVLSPSNGWRQDAQPPPDPLLLIIPTSLRFAADFIYYALRGQSTPFLVYIALFGAVGLLGVLTRPARISARAGLAGAGISLLAMYVLIVCSFAPSAYAGLSYPAGRALMPGSIALLAGLGCAALYLGHALRAIVPQAKQGWVMAAAIALVVLLNLYPLRAATATRKDIDRMAPWAARWDARDRQIRQAVAAGTLDVAARQVEVVQSLEDIGPDPDHWINKCAAVFYGANSITAAP